MDNKGLNPMALFKAEPWYCTHIVHLCTYMIGHSMCQYEGSLLSKIGALACRSLSYNSNKEMKEPLPKAMAPRATAEVERSSSNLVDPASSHMLVSKVKPCMS